MESSERFNGFSFSFLVLSSPAVPLRLSPSLSLSSPWDRRQDSSLQVRPSRKLVREFLSDCILYPHIFFSLRPLFSACLPIELTCDTALRAHHWRSNRREPVPRRKVGATDPWTRYQANIENRGASALNERLVCSKSMDHVQVLENTRERSKCGRVV